MNQQIRLIEQRKTRFIALSFLLAIFFSQVFAGIAIAQPVASNTSGPFGQPTGDFGAPMPPAPGDGPSPAPIEAGDTGAPLPVPSNTADPGTGTNFPTTVGRDRTIVRIFYKDASSPYGGKHDGKFVRTIRPDQLYNDQIQEINGILGINMLSGEQSIDAYADMKQLEAIENVLMRHQPTTWPSIYEYTTRSDGRVVKKIMRDPNQTRIPSRYEFAGTIPTVRTFARWMVLVGGVVATIFVAIQSVRVVFGHPHGAGGLASAFLGFCLLLMAYTIYKVVQLNTMNLNDPVSGVTINKRPNEAQTNEIFPTDTPGVPTAMPQSPDRSGIPVVPLGNALASPSNSYNYGNGLPIPGGVQLPQPGTTMPMQGGAMMPMQGGSSMPMQGGNFMPSQGGFSLPMPSGGAFSSPGVNMPNSSGNMSGNTSGSNSMSPLGGALPFNLNNPFEGAPQSNSQQQMTP